MVPARRHRIAAALRQRLLDGLRSGALRGGDRLPSTRELAADLDADARVIAEAYRALAAEGLVEMRPRSGIYVGKVAGDSTGAPAGPSPAWLAQVIADGVRHGVTLPALADSLAVLASGRSLAATVVAGTLDQAAGIARELRDGFGLDARGYLADQLTGEEPLPTAVRRTRLLVATDLTRRQVSRLGERLARPHVVVDVRPELVGPEWRLLLKRVTYVVVADARFAPFVHRLLATVDGAENVRILVAGRDDLAVVPPDAPTYVTEAARQRLGRNRLPGRLLPPARTLSDATTREVAEFVVAERRRAAGPATR